MRPRVFPAEDREAVLMRLAPHVASMRPRVFPAEDKRGNVEEWPVDLRFNEAAGIPRGRRQDGGRHEMPTRLQ